MKIILFDFFGVISTPVYKIVIEKYLPEHEWSDWMKKLDILDIGDMTENDLVESIAHKAGVQPDTIWQLVNVTPVVNDALLKYIDFQLSPHYQIGLLTNIPRSLLDRIIPDHIDKFDPLLVSSELRQIKPDPAIFTTAISRCNVAAHEILFIDDSVKNVEVACSLGINGIVYQSLDQLKLSLFDVVAA